MAPWWRRTRFRECSASAWPEMERAARAAPFVITVVLVRCVEWGRVGIIRQVVATDDQVVTEAVPEDIPAAPADVRDALKLTTES